MFDPPPSQDGNCGVKSMSGCIVDAAHIRTNIFLIVAQIHADIPYINKVIYIYKNVCL